MRKSWNVEIVESRESREIRSEGKIDETRPSTRDDGHPEMAARLIRIDTRLITGRSMARELAAITTALRRRAAARAEINRFGARRRI